jgi:hypothetical protein
LHKKLNKGLEEKRIPFALILLAGEVVKAKYSLIVLEQLSQISIFSSIQSIHARNLSRKAYKNIFVRSSASSSLELPVLRTGTASAMLFGMGGGAKAGAPELD